MRASELYEFDLGHFPISENLCETAAVNASVYCAATQPKVGV